MYYQNCSWSSSQKRFTANNFIPLPVLIKPSLFLSFLSATAFFFPSIFHPGWASVFVLAVPEPGLPSAFHQDCTTLLLLGGCGETRGGIWSCIYAGEKVLSLRSTSPFSYENHFEPVNSHRSERLVYEKIEKILGDTTIIFQKFSSIARPTDSDEEISLWTVEPGQNCSGRSEYIRPGAAAWGASLGGRTRGWGVQYGLSRGPHPRGRAGALILLPRLP